MLTSCFFQFLRCYSIYNSPIHVYKISGFCELVHIIGIELVTDWIVSETLSQQNSHTQLFSSSFIILRGIIVFQILPSTADDAILLMRLLKLHCT